MTTDDGAALRGAGEWLQCQLPARAPRQAQLRRSDRAPNGGVGRRADAVGAFPNEAAVVLPIGAVLLEAGDEWRLWRPCAGIEAIAEPLNPAPTNEALQLPPRAA